MLGLLIFGVGETCLIVAGLGNTPWTVLAQGLADQTPLGIGTATTVIGLLTLLLWIPLREVPGIGTLGKAVLIGPVIDLATPLFPDDPGNGLSWALVLAGILLIALGSGLYLTAALGPGPRDGLMVGIHRKAGVSLRVARALIEGTVVLIGFVLGGTVGIATVLFAIAIGPLVQLAVERFETPRWRALEDAPPDAPSTRVLEPVGEATGS
jgi:uncharacterized membrane protein YczE